MIKRILTVVCLLLQSVVLNAQVTENAARKQHELALEQLAYFTLTQEAHFYHQAITILKSTKSMYQILSKHSVSNHADAVRFETKYKRVEDALNLYDNLFFDRIVHDPNSKNSKIRFKEKTYVVTNERQQILNELLKAIKSAQFE